MRDPREEACPFTVLAEPGQERSATHASKGECQNGYATAQKGKRVALRRFDRSECRPGMNGTDLSQYLNRNGTGNSGPESGENPQSKRARLRARTRGPHSFRWWGPAATGWPCRRAVCLLTNREDQARAVGFGVHSASLWGEHVDELPYPAAFLGDGRIVVVGEGGLRAGVHLPEPATLSVRQTRIRRQSMLSAAMWLPLAEKTAIRSQERHATAKACRRHARAWKTATRSSSGPERKKSLKSIAPEKPSDRSDARRKKWRRSDSIATPQPVMRTRSCVNRLSRVAQKAAHSAPRRRNLRRCSTPSRTCRRRQWWCFAQEGQQ